LAFVTFLVWRLRIGACGVGACGFLELMTATHNLKYLVLSLIAITFFVFVFYNVDIFVGFPIVSYFFSLVIRKGVLKVNVN